MGREDERNEFDFQADPPGAETSFDELARGLASGNLSRRKALRLMGGVLAGSTLASIPGIAWARPNKPVGAKCNHNHQCASGQCVDRVCVAGGCPGGTTLCGDNCVPDCPSGQTLNPTTCECEGNLPTCPDQPCCCTCRYRDINTGAVVLSTCNPGLAPGPEGDLDCSEICSASIPSGTQLNSAAGQCAPAGQEIVCETVSTGTQCDFVTFAPCTSPPA